MRTAYAVILSDGNIVMSHATREELKEHAWTYIESLQAATGLKVLALVPLGPKEESENNSAH